MSGDLSPSTNLTIPPMPEVYTEADTEAQLDAVKVYRLDELRAYAHLGWKIAQREVALVDELADALERISTNFDPILARKPVRDVAETRSEAEAALRTYTAARQMDKEARNG